MRSGLRNLPFMTNAEAPLAAPPARTLHTLAAELREEGPVVGPLVIEPDDAAPLGALVAAGPRCAHAPSDYATVVESVREGYLLHYGEPRLLPELDPDLRLLVGDHLYARGIERLARLGDGLAVAELADLISIASRLHVGGADRAGDAEVLWLAAAVAIAAGAGDEHGRAKRELIAGGGSAALWGSTVATARANGLSGPLAEAADAVGSPLSLG